MIKFSVITVVLNRVQTIKRCMDSVAGQCYSNIEHIIIDGGSTDGTLDVINANSFPNVTLFTGPDEGLYDALNKGIRVATGDVICVLHSDDVFEDPNVIYDASRVFGDSAINITYADALIVDQRNGRPVRRYSSSTFLPSRLQYGMMPAHTTLFVRKLVYDKYNLYNTKYKIAADFDFCARIFKYEFESAYYFNRVLVRMNDGGLSNSTIKNKMLINEEILRACFENGISTNKLKLFIRYLYKIPGYIFH